MSRWSIAAIGLAILFLLVLACCPPVPDITPTPSPEGRLITRGPTDTPMHTPTPTSPPTPEALREGETWAVGNLSVTLIEHELGNCYANDFDSETCPPDGAAFLWVHLHAENIGDPGALSVRVPTSVRILYRGQELYPRYQHEMLGYPSRERWAEGQELYPGKEYEGWEAFEVPQGIDLSEPFVFVEGWDPEFQQRWQLTD